MILHGLRKSKYVFKKSPVLMKHLYIQTSFFKKVTPTRIFYGYLYLGQPPENLSHG